MYEEPYGTDMEVYETVAGNGIGSIASQVNAACEIARNLQINGNSVAPVLYRKSYKNRGWYVIPDFC